MALDEVKFPNASNCFVLVTACEEFVVPFSVPSRSESWVWVTPPCFSEIPGLKVELPAASRGAVTQGLERLKLVDVPLTTLLVLAPSPLRELKSQRGS